MVSNNRFITYCFRKYKIKTFGRGSKPTKLKTVVSVIPDPIGILFGI